jgi:hypothetical protein
MFSALSNYPERYYIVLRKIHNTGSITRKDLYSFFGGNSCGLVNRVIFSMSNSKHIAVLEDNSTDITYRITEKGFKYLQELEMKVNLDKLSHFMN